MSKNEVLLFLPTYDYTVGMVVLPLDRKFVETSREVYLKSLQETRRILDGVSVEIRLWGDPGSDYFTSLEALIDNLGSCDATAELLIKAVDGELYSDREWRPFLLNGSFVGGDLEEWLFGEKSSSFRMELRQTVLTESRANISTWRSEISWTAQRKHEEGAEVETVDVDLVKLADALEEMLNHPNVRVWKL